MTITHATAEVSRDGRVEALLRAKDLETVLEACVHHVAREVRDGRAPRGGAWSARAWADGNAARIELTIAR